MTSLLRSTRTLLGAALLAGCGQHHRHRRPRSRATRPRSQLGPLREQRPAQLLVYGARQLRVSVRRHSPRGRLGRPRIRRVSVLRRRRPTGPVLPSRTRSRASSSSSTPSRTASIATPTSSTSSTTSRTATRPACTSITIAAGLRWALPLLLAIGEGIRLTDSQLGRWSY